MVKNFWKEIKYLILLLDAKKNHDFFFVDFGDENSNVCCRFLARKFKYVFQKINVARYARNVVT